MLFVNSFAHSTRINKQALMLSFIFVRADGVDHSS
jgi:hypothetical protein